MLTKVGSTKTKLNEKKFEFFKEFGGASSYDKKNTQN